MVELTIEQKAVKAIIELSKDCDEADEFVCEYAKSSDTQKKLNYLHTLFDFRIIGRHEESNEQMVETDYSAVLSAVVNKKWW
ncbi:MAG: hypothetical protein Ta2G_15410 [Termitinemataceae bacterium]|nr:MAG: hypothetical protein Ta2G_15410 [Termitinemataceae bacterium]